MPCHKNITTIRLFDSFLGSEDVSIEPGLKHGADGVELTVPPEIEVVPHNGGMFLNYGWCQYMQRYLY